MHLHVLRVEVRGTDCDVHSEFADIYLDRTVVVALPLDEVVDSGHGNQYGIRQGVNGMAGES
jgi:hypothetical protein